MSSDLSSTLVLSFDAIGVGFKAAKAILEPLLTAADGFSQLLGMFTK